MLTHKQSHTHTIYTALLLLTELEKKEEMMIVERWREREREKVGEREMWGEVKERANKNVQIKARSCFTFGEPIFRSNPISPNTRG